MTRIPLLLVLGLAAGTALAQDSAIPWLTEPQQAVNEAKRSLRPIMAYVLASNKDRDPKLDHLQKLALADPRVVRLSQRFVPLRLSRSIHGDVLSQFGLSEKANMEISFVTPDGEVLGRLSPGEITEAGALSARLVSMLDAYAKKLYEKQVKPKLEAPELKPAELKHALQVINTFHMDIAEKELLAILDRPRLDATSRGEIYDTLAVLSTKTAVAKLLEWARGGDARAAKALTKCTPVGAEHMLSELAPDEDTVDFAVYKTVTQICEIRNVKAAKFFETAKPQLKKEEVDRVTRLVKEAAQRWKETNNEPG
jgi:hypothetical protein